MLYSNCHALFATLFPLPPLPTQAHSALCPPLSTLPTSLFHSQAINDIAREFQFQLQFSKLVFSAEVATSSLRADKRQGISHTPTATPAHTPPVSFHMWCVCVCVCGRYCGSDSLSGSRHVRPSLTRSFTARCKATALRLCRLAHTLQAREHINLCHLFAALEIPCIS